MTNFNYDTSLASTNADLIIAYLEEIGVEYVFGIAGGAIEPLLDAIDRRSASGGPQFVMAAHETGAAHMAEGYARESGVLGVCIATSGPGATNLITGVSCAHDNSIPVLAITGQPVLSNFGRRALQESSCTGINIMQMFGTCTKYNSLVTHPAQLEQKVISAILNCKGLTPSTAHLSIPVDIQRAKPINSSPKVTLSKKICGKKSYYDIDATEELAKLLGQNLQPVILIGPSSKNAIASIMKFVHIHHCPFVTTPDAKGLINPYHENYCGVFGLAGHESAIEHIAQKSNLILACGMAFDEFSSGGWDANLLSNRLIHIDDNESNFSLSPMAKLHVYGDITIIFDTLCNAVAPKIQSVVRDNDKKFMNYTHEISELYKDKNANVQTPHLKPQHLFFELSQRFPPGSRFVADAGNSMLWAIQLLNHVDRRLTPERRSHLHGRKERRTGKSPWLRVPINFAPMGWAIGTSIGIARADPTRHTICITGDGSFLMSGSDIVVALQENLPIVFVILNDGVYGMVMHGQRMNKAAPIGYQLPSVDFRGYCQALGIDGLIIEKLDDFEKIDLQTITQKKKPLLLDVRIDREEVPPMHLRVQTLNELAAINN